MSSQSPARGTEEKTGTVQEMRPAQRFRAYMLDRAARESSTDAEEVSANQVDKIFAAETDDEIWDADSGGTIQARDCVGLEIEILSMRAQESDRFEGAPYYVNIDVTVLGGDRAVLTRNGLTIGANAVLQTGAELIIAKIRKFEAKGSLPVRGVISGTETNSGFMVLKLARMPERTTATTK